MSEANPSPSFEKKRIIELKREAKGYWTIGKLFKVLLFSALFFGIYVALFNLVNMDLSPAKEIVEKTEVAEAPNFSEELKKRLGSTTFSVESYEDWAKRFDLYERNRGLDSDTDSDGLPNYLEYVYGTNPLKADSDGDKFTDRQELTNGFDPDAPGDAKPTVLVRIDKINIEAPMVWSTKADENSMLKDLENGLNHYPKSAAPGQIGNMVISGHSSNYLWAKGNYNHIFENLNNLEAGDGITITTIQKNGRVITYHYIVTEKFITAPDDEAIFAESDQPTITLSTCWPLGTNFKRVIVKGELAK